MIMHGRRRGAGAVMLGAVGLASGTSLGQQPVMLPLLPGLTASEATGVSDDGRVLVGTCWNVGAPSAMAVVWTLGDGGWGTPSPLGRLPGAATSGASAVSADGRTVAGTSGGRAFRWTARGGLVPLASLAPDSPGDWSMAMNADGSVIVGGSNRRSVLWRGDEPPLEVGVRASFRYNAATGVSDDGSVVSSIFDDGEVHAIRWLAGAGIREVAPRRAGAALGVSGDGVFILGSTGFAFRWSEAAGLQEFYVTPSSAYAERSSRDGSIIVGRRNVGQSQPERGMMWTARTGAVDFQDYAASRGVEFGPWVVCAVAAISRDGRVVAGWSQRAGEPSSHAAWVLDWPCIACPPDADCNGLVDDRDLAAYVAAFESGGPGADRNRDGFVDFFDYDDFVAAFEAGC